MTQANINEVEFLKNLARTRKECRYICERSGELCKTRSNKGEQLCSYHKNRDRDRVPRYVSCSIIYFFYFYNAIVERPVKCRQNYGRKQRIRRGIMSN